MVNLESKTRVLKFVFLLCFSILIFKFWLVTNFYNEGYSELAKHQTNIILKNPMPRGEIYDRNGKLIVGNEEKKNLVYLNNYKKSNEDMWKLAQDLVDNIQIDEKDYTLVENDYKDLIIREDQEEIYKRYNKNKAKYDTEAEDFDVDAALRDQVTKEDYDKLVKKYGKKAVDIKILMDSSSTSNPKVLAKDLSSEDVYYINQNVGNLGGCFVMSDWQRTYPYKNTLKTFLGSVGDIPVEDLETYQSLGYSQADQIGTSYVEKEEEMYLRSTPQQVSFYFDTDGNIVNYEIIENGESGDDIKLTIDIELQKKVDEILRDSLKNDSFKYHKTNYASVTDPNTGEILALSGIYEDGKDYYDVSIQNFTSAYEVGSIVKPALLLIGYYLDVWDWDTVINDAPMDLGSGIVKASFHNYGPINENDAIKHSSNVYFYYMILKIAGINYTGPSSLPGVIDDEYFTTIRKEYSMFGLGTKTGIDFDNELEGVKNSSNGVGLYMDLANGQYDTYTPLQTNQYIATLANGKARMKMNYLYSINEPSKQGVIGPEIKRINSEVMNYLKYDPKDIKHVQETLAYPSTPGGTTAAAADSRYKMGSKSGTSESFYYEEGMKSAYKTNNSSFIAYVPYDKPKIAVSVLYPYWTPDGDLNKESATNAGGKILDAAYDLGYIK